MLWSLAKMTKCSSLSWILTSENVCKAAYVKTGTQDLASVWNMASSQKLGPDLGTQKLHQLLCHSVHSQMPGILLVFVFYLFTRVLLFALFVYLFIFQAYDRSCVQCSITQNNATWSKQIKSLCVKAPQGFIWNSSKTLWERYLLLFSWLSGCLFWYCELSWNTVAAVLANNQKWK